MELFISITGQAATGKTTIAKIIEDALRDKGFKVLQNDVDLTSDVIKPDGWVERNTEGIKGKETTISIDTVGVRRLKRVDCPNCGGNVPLEDFCFLCGGVLGRKCKCLSRVDGYPCEYCMSMNETKKVADIGVTTDKEIILGMG